MSDHMLLLDIKNCVGRVHSSLIFRGFANQSLIFSKRDERWSCKISLLVGDLGHVNVQKKMASLRD